MNLCLILHGIASRVVYHCFIDQRKTLAGFMPLVFRAPTDCITENVIPCRGLCFAGWADRWSSTASFQLLPKIRTVTISIKAQNRESCDSYESQDSLRIVCYYRRNGPVRDYFAVVSISPIMRRIEALRAAVSMGAGSAVESVSTSINPRPAINGLISGS